MYATSNTKFQGGTNHGMQIGQLITSGMLNCNFNIVIVELK